MTSELLRVLADVAPKEHLSTDELLGVLYSELRALARARLRSVQPGQTLQATALVHEAYLRLVRNEDPGWDSRAHFFAAAAQAMRDILVEQARSKMTKKRGGGRVQIDSGSVEPTIEPPSDEVLAVHEALRRLEQDDPRKGRIANLRYFARMTASETAEALGISIGTVGREWRYIRAWLESELRDSDRS
ncbi:MAG: sigma-70 family RNA polymerase sigma factor [Phycisphaerales bacterium]|nr:MAG: sigma-70 family RNA polymerase sigma factor [Phycisphaerales bacterium]